MPLACSHLMKHMQWPYQSKIAGPGVQMLAMMPIFNKNVAVLKTSASICAVNAALRKR